MGNPRGLLDVGNPASGVYDIHRSVPIERIAYPPRRNVIPPQRPSRNGILRSSVEHRGRGLAKVSPSSPSVALDMHSFAMARPPNGVAQRPGREEENHGTRTSTMFLTIFRLAGSPKHSPPQKQISINPLPPTKAINNNNPSDV